MQTFAQFDMALTNAVTPSLPAWLFLASIPIYCFGRIFLHLIVSVAYPKRPVPLHENIDAEKGTVATVASTDKEEKFQLEKRAFLSRVCLNTCSSACLTMADVAVCIPPESV